MRSNLSRFPALSFRYKMMLTAIACILIPACISLLATYYLTKDAVKEQAVSNAQESLQLVDGYVSNLLKNMLNIANFIQIDREMNTIMKEHYAGETYEGDDAEYRQFSERQKILSKIDNISIIGDKVFVTILLPDGMYFTNYNIQEYDPVRLFGEAWFSELDRSSGLVSVWSGARPTTFETYRQKYPYQISLGRTLRNAGGQIYGYVVVTIFEEQVHQIFERLAADQEMMLLDDTGTIVSHTDPQQIGKPFPYAHPEHPDEKGRIMTIGGEAYLLSELELSSIAGWKLVSLVPYQQAVSRINSIYNSAMAFQFVSFFAFLFVLVYFLRKFTSPLVRLGRLAATVQRGNLEVRSHIRGNDEIGRLGQSFDQMLDRIKDMIREVTLEQTRKRKAELAMLQAQITPHFLFNVLNSIRMKVMRKGDRESADMISSLSRLMRMTIENRQETVTLHEELETAVDYVKLMNMRQKEQVELDIQVPVELFFERIPRFVLQPLIENALIHGLNRRTGRIVIEAARRDSQIAIRVEDNGQGMTRQHLEALRLRLESPGTEERSDVPAAGSTGLTGFGLRNVAERMRFAFGKGFALNLDSEPGKGTRIEMRFPSREGRTHVQSDGR